MVNVAIVCEGPDDKAFLEIVINHLGFSNKNISYYVLGGKSKFFELSNTKYQDLKLEIDSNQIEKILFILDADDVKSDLKYGGFGNTQAALNTVITNLELNDFSQTYIMCDPSTQTGYLESFILSTISTAQKRCIEAFLNCSNFNSRENHKAILNKIYKLAYPNAPYDFEHAHFDLLKAELNNLFN